MSSIDSSTGRVAVAHTIALLAVLQFSGLGHAAGSAVVRADDPRVSDESESGPKPAAEKKQEFYFLYLKSGTDDWKRAYDDDKTVRLTGGYSGGSVVILVNGSPIKIFSHGVFILRLTEWVHEGENSISFQGEFKTPIVVKVITLPDQHASLPVYLVERMVAKTLLHPGEALRPLEFDVGPLERENTSFEKLPDDPAERAELEKQIRARIAAYHKAFVNHDPDAAAATVAPTYRHKEIAWLHPKGAPIEVTNRIRRLAGDQSITMIDSEDLKLIWGERNVLLYTGVETESPEKSIDVGAYSFRLASEDFGNRTRIVKPLMLVRVQGEWLFW